MLNKEMIMFKTCNFKFHDSSSTVDKILLSWWVMRKAIKSYIHMIKVQMR